MVTLTFDQLRALMAEAWEHGRQWEENECDAPYRRNGGWVIQPSNKQVNTWKTEAREPFLAVKCMQAASFSENQLTTPYRSGEPTRFGVYLCRVGTQHAAIYDDLFLSWSERGWFYCFSDQPYRSDVPWFIGPLQRRMTPKTNIGIK